MKTKLRFLVGISAVALVSLPTAYAGPYILAGTDSDDHGFVTGTVASGTNQDGWFFMQRAIENLAPGVTNGNKVVAILGSDVGTQAHNAALSAFNNSSLPGLGWTVSTYNNAGGAATGALTNFLAGGLTGAGIVMMDSGSNVTGGASASERGAFTTNATNINSFLAAGGGLFSQANGYGWVTALIPTLTDVDDSATGLALTPAGQAAFPGLTNGDLSAGPWHNYFTNVGAIPILATSTTAPIGQAVIIGASGGSVTNPDPPRGVPDGGSFALVYLALGGIAFATRRFALKHR